MTDTTTKDLVKRLRGSLPSITAINGNKPAETVLNAGLIRNLFDQAADTIERLTASAPADGDLRNAVTDREKLIAFFREPDAYSRFGWAGDQARRSAAETAIYELRNVLASKSAKPSPANEAMKQAYQYLDNLHRELHAKSADETPSDEEQKIFAEFSRIKDILYLALYSSEPTINNDLVDKIIAKVISHCIATPHGIGRATDGLLENEIGEILSLALLSARSPDEPMGAEATANALRQVSENTRTPEADADAWMAICNETGGRLFAHTKERAEIRGREAYGKIYGHAGHAFEVVPLYAAAKQHMEGE